MVAETPTRNDTNYVCQNCSFSGGEDDFIGAKHIESRHEIGDPYSDLECPKCGALAYPEMESKRLPPPVVRVAKLTSAIPHGKRIVMGMAATYDKDHRLRNRNRRRRR